MSRSFKHNPVYTDGSPRTTKEKKRIANSRVRNTEDIPSGGAYKKVFPSWDIHDFANRWTWAEAKRFYEGLTDDDFLKKHYPTLKTFYRYWRTICMNK